MRNISNRYHDFWSCVDIQGENECWNWKLSSHIESGYGRFQINHKKYLSHRLAYDLFYGDLTDDQDVLHTCLNEKCCNPNHLRLGTHTDNMRDPDHAKINFSVAEDIRKEYATGEYTQNELAKIYSIDQTQISNIVTYKQWKP